jgi:hypothetical protein
MKRRFLLAISLLLVLVMSLAGWTQVEGTPSNEELLAAMDAARFLDSDTGYVVQVMEIHAVRPDSVEEAAIRLSMKTIDGEALRLRIDFLAPEDSVGQSFLILEDDSVLLCTPDLAMPLRISGGTDVFGDSTVSTTAGIQFAEAYVVLDRQATMIDDVAVLELQLEAIELGTAYPSATVWIDAETYFPIEAVLYALSGDPLNRITYDEYGTFPFEDVEAGFADSYAVVQIVENLIQEGFTTTLTISGIELDPIPEHLLDPEQFCRDTDDS